MIKKLSLPNNVGIADSGIELVNVNGVCIIMRNGSMIGTLDTSSRGYHLSIDDVNGNGLDAVFSSLENVFRFLVARPDGIYTDIR